MSAMLKKPVLWVLLLASVGVAVFVFNVSKPGAAVVGVTDRRVDREVPLGSNFQVLSLNVFHDYPNCNFLKERLILLSMFIKEKHPDVVCLQEIPWTRDMQNAAAFVAEAVGFNHVYFRANGNKSLIYFEEGQAILSRYPIKETAFTTLEPQAGFFENRTALFAKIDSPRGDIGVVSTQLTSDPAAQMGQVESLLKFVDAHAGDMPTVIGGDFNMEPGSPAYKSVTQHWSDIFRLAHPDEDGNTCCIDDMSASPDIKLKRRVDYLFARTSNSGKQVQIDMSYLAFEEPVDVGSQFLRYSDRAGVWAQINF